jgi:HSP20 family molecular chaperone IbpA
VRDLIPWGRGNNRAPAPYREDDRNPFLSLHREMNRVFDQSDKAQARFRNGVLTVTLPKSPDAQSRATRISISN